MSYVSIYQESGPATPTTPSSKKPSSKEKKDDDDDDGNWTVDVSDAAVKARMQGINLSSTMSL